jgi:pimeloyl-ACP methyl ester carboxylesterase
VQIVDPLQATLPDARTASFDGVGHFANLEQPAEFNSVVRTFLTRE